MARTMEKLRTSLLFRPMVSFSSGLSEPITSSSSPRNCSMLLPERMAASARSRLLWRAPSAMMSEALRAAAAFASARTASKFTSSVILTSFLMDGSTVGLGSRAAALRPTPTDGSAGIETTDTSRGDQERTRYSSLFVVDRSILLTRYPTDTFDRIPSTTSWNTS